VLASITRVTHGELLPSPSVSTATRPPSMDRSMNGSRTTLPTRRTTLLPRVVNPLPNDAKASPLRQKSIVHADSLCTHKSQVTSLRHTVTSTF